MKIAIHHRPGSYSEYWIGYCQKHNIQYKIVDAYANDIIEQVADCDAFMWHFHPLIYKDFLFAKQLIYVIEKQMEKVTYPNYDTCWHFDDKIGQKYLLEAIKAHLVPTYIFYARDEALEWIQHTTFPKVFKLRSGEKSTNVWLVENITQAKKLIEKAFSFGIQKNRHLIRVYQRWNQFRKGKCSLKWFLKGIITPYSYKERFYKEELGYVYFQDYMPNNNFDIRITIINNRAVAVKRLNRKNDFRASGSGMHIFDKEQIDIEFIKTAFEIYRQLKMQSSTFDFLRNKNGQIVLSEISYNYDIKTGKNYPGYWDDNLIWHKTENLNINDWIINNVIEKINSI